MQRTALTRSATVVLAFAMVTTLFTLAAPAASASPVRPSAEARMVAHINASRALYGLPALRQNLQMVRLAREWARSMANQRRVYHRPNLADVVDGNFSRLADNVGFTRLSGVSDAQLVDRLHTAFMASTGHRTQILGRFNLVGVGIHRVSGGGMYIAVNFVQGPTDGFPLYRDAADSPFRRPIAHLFRRGAVHGCTRSRFCPRSAGTRRYTAATIDRALNVRTAQNYVSLNCATSYTCRSEEMTRGELAVLIAEALRLWPVSGRWYTDVSRGNREMINAVVAAGIMPGCSATKFCPGREVSRGGIAKTVYRAIVLR